MKLNCDWVLVKVDSELNTFAGLIHDENGNEIKLILNPYWHPTIHAKICGEVVAAPQYLSGMDNPLYEIYQGSPRPMTYRSGDYIQTYKSHLSKAQQKKFSMPYLAGMYNPNYQTHFGVPVEVQPGDKVYFHYNSLLKEENYMYRDPDGMLVYKIHYSNLFCRVRTGEITMLNSYCLVSQYVPDDVEKIDVGDGLIVTGKKKGDLVLAVDEKPAYLSGVLRHIGEGIGPDKRSVKPGAFVLFRPSSEFINTVEEEIYYVMRQWDMVAEWIEPEELTRLNLIGEKYGASVGDQTIAPVGDYLMVIPDESQIVKNNLHVFDPNKPIQNFKQGDLFLLSDSVQNQKKKNSRAGFGKVIASSHTCSNIYQNKNVVYEKSSYYIWIPEYGIALVRFGDVLGVLPNIQVTD